MHASKPLLAIKLVFMLRKLKSFQERSKRLSTSISYEQELNILVIILCYRIYSTTGYLLAHLFKYIFCFSHFLFLLKNNDKAIGIMHCPMTGSVQELSSMYARTIIAGN